MLTATLELTTVNPTTLRLANQTIIRRGEELIDTAPAKHPVVKIIFPDGYYLDLQYTTAHILDPTVTIGGITAKSHWQKVDIGSPFTITISQLENALASGVLKDADDVVQNALPWAVFPDGQYKLEATFYTNYGNTYYLEDSFLLYANIERCIYDKIDALSYCPTDCADLNKLQNEVTKLYQYVRAMDICWRMGKENDALMMFHAAEQQCQNECEC